MGRLPPVARKRREGDVHPLPLAHEAVRPGADRPRPEAVRAGLLEVLPGEHDSGRGGGGPVEGHEVRPRLLQVESDDLGIDYLDLPYAGAQLLGARALVALEAPLDVVAGQRVAVVEAEP